MHGQISKFLIAVGVLAVAASCGKVKVRDCKKDTVLVAFTLADAASSATSIQVDVSMPGNPTKSTVLPLTQRTLNGTVEVDFQSYQLGREMTLTLTAKDGDRDLGSSRVTQSLQENCTVVSMSIAPPPAAPPCADCQLTAVNPQIGNIGDVLALEGTFQTSAKVNFPGGTSVEATVLGSHRALVTVPPGATTGNLTVTTGGVTTAPVRFRRASFALGLQNFKARYEQTDVARPMPKLVVGRVDHATVIVGDYLYVIGGARADGTAVDSIERAMINADGTLGPFTLTDLRLQYPRFLFSAQVIGQFFYILGGLGQSGVVVPYVERAVINSDGTLSSFRTLESTDPYSSLFRYMHTSVVIGNYLYLLGGQPYDYMEVTPIHPDGTIGAFSRVAGVSIHQQRWRPSAVVLGKFLYVIGGGVGAVGSEGVERAPINSDGTLGQFTTVVTLANARLGQAVTTLGGSLYVVGGSSFNNAIATVERATADADGALGSFSLVNSVSLNTARYGHTSVLLGNNLYVIGGGYGTILWSGPGGPYPVLDSVECASINVGATITTFSSVDEGHAVNRRIENSTVVVGKSVYLVGGNNSISYVNAVERAPVNPDGTMGQFATVDGVSVVRPRRVGHTIAVIGSFLYIVGGLIEDQASYLPTDSVERTPINSDGSLGTFEVVSGLTLNTARYGHVNVVVGDCLYVLGGLTYYPPHDVSDVERACIRPDGSLTNFQVQSGLQVQASYGTGAVLRDSLYLIGGSAGSGVKYASIRPDGQLNPFQDAPGILTTAYSQHTSPIIGNAIYLIGNYDARNAVWRTTFTSPGLFSQPFAPANDVLLQAGRSEATSVVLDNFLYILGGNPSGSTERATLQ